MSNPNNSKSYIPILIIFILAFIERTFFDLGPNVELITLAMLLASTHLSRNTALKLTLLLLITTDLVIGNSRIFIFTWSGFLIPLIAISLFKAKAIKNRVLTATLLGFASNLFFFVWTNFGVWLLDSFNMYPDSIAGLAQSYIAGLPFLKLQLLSTLSFVPAGFMLTNWLTRHLPEKGRYWSLNIRG